MKMMFCPINPPPRASFNLQRNPGSHNVAVVMRKFLVVGVFCLQALCALGDGNGFVFDEDAEAGPNPARDTGGYGAPPAAPPAPPAPSSYGAAPQAAPQQKGESAQELPAPQNRPSLPEAQGEEAPEGSYGKSNPFIIHDDDDVDKGGEASKACRYDDALWSDCDPFELIRYRVLRLISGGRQCEEVKNITKHCTPYEFPAGTNWLIAEHRKCIAELKRLKAMIADLAQYLDILHEKGRQLYNAYLQLKSHLDELRQKIEALKRENDQQKGVITKLREELEDWKERSRITKAQLDEVRNKYHELQNENKELAQKIREHTQMKERCQSENNRLGQKIHVLEAENSELKRRVLEAEKYKLQLIEIKVKISKLEFKAGKLADKVVDLKDALEDCRLELFAMNSTRGIEEPIKDTKVDLNMEMWIVHNKSKQFERELKFNDVKTTTEKPKEAARCLISYYGVTNETCWYESKGESAEAQFADTVGEHLVEAHFKYFTITVQHPNECDRAAHLHYEFLFNRCKPKHYLPVISIYRKNSEAVELTTHVYPKPNIPQPGQPNRCWITFLGPQGHCERRKDQFPLYNSDDTPDGYAANSGSSKSACLARAKVWKDYCETPVIATYLPDGISSTFHDEDIQHDTHGGVMFEEPHEIQGQVNPESVNPHTVVRPVHEPEDYEDTPEYRKSLHLRGQERELILKKLRERLGIRGRKANGTSGNIRWHGRQGEHADQSHERVDIHDVKPTPSPVAFPAHSDEAALELGTAGPVRGVEKAPEGPAVPLESVTSASESLNRNRQPERSQAPAQAPAAPAAPAAGYGY